MKNLKTLAYKVKPTIPESNSLAVVDDELYYYNENNIEYKISSSDEVTVSWVDVEDKPATFAPTIGTTATTAKAGNYQPTWAQVTGKPSTFAPSAHTHTWADITDKPAIIASGATQAAARTAIGAGTGNSNLAIGTTASTAKAGNYTPSATEVVNALRAMTPEQIGDIQTLLGIEIVE